MGKPRPEIWQETMYECPSIEGSSGDHTHIGAAPGVLKRSRAGGGVKEWRNTEWRMMDPFSTVLPVSGGGSDGLQSAETLADGQRCYVESYLYAISSNGVESEYKH